MKTHLASEHTDSEMYICQNASDPIDRGNELWTASPRYLKRHSPSLCESVINIPAAAVRVCGPLEVVIACMLRKSGNAVGLLRAACCTWDF